jgi:hypothetical protein
MLVKIVDTVVSTDSAGRPVDAVPVREWQTGETSVSGVPLATVSLEDSETGVPVRFVEGKTALNSAGQPIDTIPTTGGGPKWSAVGADMSGDFVENQYYEAGVGILPSCPFTVVRNTSAWRTEEDGKTFTEYPPNVLRRDARGAYIEGYARKRMTLYPVTPANWAASASPGPTRTTQAADGSFTPQKVARPASGGAFTAIVDNGTGWALTNSRKYAAKAFFKFGTSLRVRMVIRSRLSPGAGTNSLVSNPTTTGASQGLLAANTSVAGQWTGIQQVDRSTDIKELTALFTAAASAPADAGLELGPDAPNQGEDVTVCGGQITEESQPGEIILGSPSTQFTQAADVATYAGGYAGLKSLAVTFTLRSLPHDAEENEIWHYGNTTDYVRLMYKTSSGKLFAQAYVGGVQTASLDLGTVSVYPSRSAHAVVFSWANSDFSAALDNNAEVTSSSGNAPTGMTALILGQDAAGLKGSGFLITNYAGYKRAL